MHLSPKNGTGGGNAFRLLQQLRAHKLLEPIRERVLTARVPFLGVSAGAVVACPTIQTSNDMPVCDPGGLDALGLVDFQVGQSVGRPVKPLGGGGVIDSSH